jgi:hypothetical protein
MQGRVQGRMPGRGERPMGGQGGARGRGPVGVRVVVQVGVLSLPSRPPVLWHLWFATPTSSDPTSPVGEAGPALRGGEPVAALTAAQMVPLLAAPPAAVAVAVAAVLMGVSSVGVPAKVGAGMRRRVCVQVPRRPLRRRAHPPRRSVPGRRG